MTARPYHHGNLRSALVDAAERALSEGGVGELSLREVARRVGVSHAAPRRHFADKRALLDALAIDGFERLERELGAAMAGAGLEFDARILAFSQTYVRFATEHAALLDLMFAGKHRRGVSDALRQASERAFAAPIALIEEGQASGDVLPGDPERVATFAFAVLQGLAAMINGGMLDGSALDDVVAEAVERVVLGLRPRA
jgi:AcrR family transcriptional regulator